MGVTLLLASATLVARVATCLDLEESWRDWNSRLLLGDTHRSTVALQHSTTLHTRGFPHLDLTSSPQNNRHAPSPGLFGMCRHTGPYTSRFPPVS